MKLYYVPGACSLSPHIVAREANLPVTLVRVILADRTTDSGEKYLEVNPKGYVPALRLESGEVLTEGVAIVQYLANRLPGLNLLPNNGSMPYYRALEWLTFISSELHKGFSGLFRNDLTDAEKAAIVVRLTKRFDYLEHALAVGPFLLGEHFTVADAYCYTVLRWSPRADIDLKTYPNIAAYVARVQARPAVQLALTEEELPLL